MELTDLYDIAEEDGIDIIDVSLDSHLALSVNDNGHCTIALDSAGMTTAEEKTTLAHEMGHCEKNAFYDESATVEEKRICEGKADRWAIENLIPLADILEAYKAGITNRWELAEYFGVTEEFMEKALQKYTA